MSPMKLHSRSSATALCLCALLLAASPPAPAQTPWDAQDQADMWGRLQAQRLIRSPEPAPLDAAERGKAADPTRAHKAGRDDAAGPDPRHHPGHGNGPGLGSGTCSQRIDAPSADRHGSPD